MKLCKDCKHCKNRECHAPQNMVTDPVTGQSKVGHYRYCTTRRFGGPIAAIIFGQCGKNARWFEPK